MQKHIQNLNKPVRNISIILIVVAVAALIIVPRLLSEKKKTQNLITQDSSIPIDVFVIKPVQLENEVNTVGTIIANEEVDIKSELPRKIVGIYFREGSYIPKGKVLFKLDDSDLLAQLRKLQLDEELNLKQYNRESQLIERGLMNQEEHDIRQTTIEKIRADIDLLNITLDKTEIIAPFSGIAGFRNVSMGSLVSTQNILTTIQDIGRVKIDFSIPEKYMSSFKKGQEIKFKVEGYDDEFSGTVLTFDPKIDEGTRSIILRAVASNNGNRLLPGSFVKVKLEMSDITGAVMVPSEAIIPQLKGQSVFVYQNGLAASHDVEIGIRTEKDVQITSGVNPGDTVITTNILRLRPDSKVKIVNVN